MNAIKTLSVAAALMIASPAFAQSAASLQAREGLRLGRAHVPSELLVQFKPSAATADHGRALGRVNGKQDKVVLAKSDRPDGKGDLVTIKLPPGRAIADAMTQLEADGSVEFAEPNWIYQHNAIRTNSNDPALASTCLNNGVPCAWGMLGATTSPANPYGTGALAAWNNGASCSAAIHVGVVDEGVMISHPDLQSNIWVNAREIATDSYDNDRNGYVNDVNGWDFVTRDKTVFDGVADDHGTHVAGTIAASTNNATGVMGMCGSAKLISAKFIGATGGTTANAIAGINYITNLKLRQGLKIVATNNSWGGGGYSQSLYDAINSANNANILFVAAAGNNGTDIDAAPYYPAAYKLPNVIAVAAIDAKGAKASFSNYGANTVAIAAPGVSILSTVPTSSTTGGYSYYNGTSMATPHVTGAAALYASMNPCATAAQIKTAILSKAAVDPTLATYVAGGKRLDVSNFKAELSCTAP